jgi:CBS domain containing-hemolysin-like protein
MLFFSFVFSGSETALFAFSKSEREKIRQDTGLTIKKPGVIFHLNIIEALLQDPSRLLATILFSNLLVNTTASSLFTLFVIIIAKHNNWSRDLLITIGGVVMTVILIVCGEVTPKVIALRKPSRFSLRTAWFINFLSKIFSFITVPLRKLGDWFLAILNKYIRKTPFPSQDDLTTIIELSKEQGLIVPDEETFLFNLIELSNRRVSEIMTPRIQMFCIEQNTKISEALKLVTKKDTRLVSRIPIFQGSVDNITGVLYLKDLITKIRTRTFSSQAVENIARPAYFVPENKILSELLEELRKKDSHIAIVVDEFGQTAGLVTLEDILEVLLGEIRDEYDLTSQMPYEKINENTYLVSGDIDLRALDHLMPNFAKDIPRQAGYRLSGFIHHQWGRIPKLGEVLIYSNFRMEIKEISKRRIDKILITRI